MPNMTFCGAHWGGGLWIRAMDQALTGLLMLKNGNWNGQQLISKDWIAECRTPCALNDVYGYLWWLNTGRRQFPSAPASSFFFIGVGTNLVWMNPQDDMVVVARWLEKERVDGFIGKVMEALKR